MKDIYEQAKPLKLSGLISNLEYEYGPKSKAVKKLKKKLKTLGYDPELKFTDIKITADLDKECPVDITVEYFEEKKK